MVQKLKRQEIININQFNMPILSLDQLKDHYSQPTTPNPIPSNGVVTLDQLKQGTRTPPGVFNPTTVTQMPAPQGGLTGAINATKGFMDKTVGTAANLMFGSTGKTVGSMITGTVNKTEQLAGHAPTFKDTGNPTAMDIAFTGLEAIPGTAELKGVLKALPYGEKLAAGLKDVFEFIPNKLKESAVNTFTKALAPTGQEMKGLAQKVVPKLLEQPALGKEGSMALTREGLVGKAEQAMAKYGGEIDSFFKSLPETAKIKVQPLLDALEKSKAGFTDLNAQGVKVVLDEQAVKHIEDVQKVLAQYGNDMTPASLRKVRQVWDAAVAQAKGYAGKTLNEASLINIKKEGANAIRAELAKQYPEIAALNAKYSMWSNTAKVAEATIKRNLGKAATKSGLAGTAGALFGAQRGESGQGIAIDALLGAGGVQLIGSPGWRMVSATLKNKLADALASNAGKQTIRGIINAIHNSITNQKSSSE